MSTWGGRDGVVLGGHGGGGGGGGGPGLTRAFRQMSFLYYVRRSDDRLQLFNRPTRMCFAIETDVPKIDIQHFVGGGRPAVMSPASLGFRFCFLATTFVPLILSASPF